MLENSSLALAPVFAAVGQALLENRDRLNQSDPVNGNHGDHVVEIFQIATQAAAEKPEASLAESLDNAAARLEVLQDNASAQIYARGLRQIAEQTRIHQVSLEELAATIQEALRDEKSARAFEQASMATARTGEVMKCLLSGLAGWNRLEEGKPGSPDPLDLGAMLEFGMAYIQAKNRANEHGGERAGILADAAASASPLGKYPHRYESGVIAIQALLKALQTSSYQ